MSTTLFVLTLHARAAPSPETIDEARALMVDGNADLHAGKAAEALAKLERSFALVPSPNTELLVARALLELGRKVDAAHAFEHAEDEARRRAAAAEVKYKQTADAAHTEGAAVRAQLGTLRVHVARVAGTTLLVDGQEVALASEGDTSLLHEPGRAEIVVRQDEGEQKQIVTIVAGTTIQMEFAGKGAPPVSRQIASGGDSPPPRKATQPSWPLPAALVAGGVTLVGAGAFTFFGLRSESTWSDLSGRCGPNACGPTERGDADRAKSDQTIANVSLAVASVAAAATIAFVVIRLTSPGRTTARLESLGTFSGL